MARLVLTRYKKCETFIETRTLEIYVGVVMIGSLILLLARLAKLWLSFIILFQLIIKKTFKNLYRLNLIISIIPLISPPIDPLNPISGPLVEHKIACQTWPLNPLEWLEDEPSHQPCTKSRFLSNSSLLWTCVYSKWFLAHTPYHQFRSYITT